MKIAVWHYLPSGGGKRALYHHIKGLKALGHKIESWCPDSVAGEYLPLSELIRENSLPLPKYAPGLTDRFLTKAFGYSILAVKEKLYSLDAHCRLAAEEINAGDFDVVFVNSSKFLAAAPISKYLKKPAVLYLQEAYRQHHEIPWPTAGTWINPKEKIRSLLETHWRKTAIREEISNARLFGKVLVNSQFSRETIGKIYGIDPVVCYLGIDTVLFSPAAGEKQDYAVALGRIVPNKGVRRSILSLASMKESLRPRLIWIGDSESLAYKNEMAALAQENNVRLEFKVMVADKELVGLLSRAKFMIYTPHDEPFGFAPLEANACGTPVVALAEGGVKETVRGGVNGILIQQDDPVIFAAEIEKLFQDKSRLENLSRQARVEVEGRWKWEDAVARLEDFLKEAVKKI